MGAGGASPPPERRSHFKAIVECYVGIESVGLRREGRGKACLSICALYIHSQAAYTSPNCRVYLGEE